MAGITYDILFVAGSFLFSLYFIYLDVNAPLMPLFRRLGLYTYTLYIFHGMYFSAMRRIAFDGNRFSDHFIIWIGFCLFFIGGAMLEETFNHRFNVQLAFENFKNKMK